MASTVEGRAFREGGMWEDDSGRDYFNGFLILGAKSVGAEAGDMASRVGGGVGGVGTDGLFTETSGATGTLCISSASCPGFSAYSRDHRRGETMAGYHCRC
ncbi:hypothetical protein ILYODFUR_003997 [Ilyodon furcidens]|uniref:Uncharacterized protein n=1 Tax=Ilyodon furcidens TaxID=33524 RepID=A0ABV0U2H7_9TELE